MTKISVIIPVYNVEAYLNKCLDSIVNQTLNDIEIIIVNDGSCDGSPEITGEFASKDKRIKVINQTNQGQSAARNRGIEAAQGEYIGFVDSDDWIAPDFYEKLYERAKVYDADIAAANMLVAGDDKSPRAFKYKKEYVSANLEKKLQIFKTPNENPSVNKIYKRSEVLRHNLKFMEGVTSEDMLFMLQAVYYLKLAVVTPGTSYYYNVREGSTERTFNEARIRSGAIIVEAAKQFAKEHDIKLIWNDIHSDKKITVYKVFGIPVVRIKKTDMCTKYYLFGINIIEKKEFKRL